MFLVALVLFRKHPFEPTCLSVSEPLIHERGIVTDEKLFATTITPERCPFPGRSFTFSSGPVPSLLPRPSSIELLRTRSIRIASTFAHCAPAGPRGHGRADDVQLISREPPNKIRADRNRHHNDGVFFVALVNTWFQIFLHHEAQGAAFQATRKLASDARAVPPLWSGKIQFKDCHVGELHGVILVSRTVNGGLKFHCWRTISRKNARDPVTI